MLLLSFVVQFFMLNDIASRDTTGAEKTEEEASGDADDAIAASFRNTKPIIARWASKPKPISLATTTTGAAASGRPRRSPRTDYADGEASPGPRASDRDQSSGSNYVLSNGLGDDSPIDDIKDNLEKY